MTNCFGFLVNPPSSTKWRIYNHCAALTRLYAIYENFVEGLLADFLGTLPSLFSYSELGIGFQKEHRNGIAYILQQLDSYRYRDILLKETIRDYHDALSGIENYRVLPQSLLAHPQNLALEVVEDLFKRLNINNLRQWVTGHSSLKRYIDEIRGGQNTVDAELRAFVQYRNDAAHGEITDVLSKDELATYCEFVSALCRALYECVNHKIITRRMQINTGS